MRSDKLSQAAITAVVQMARVLGMHTVAKRTETAAEHEWLTALGVDFVQSNSMSPPVAIEALSKTANPARPQGPVPDITHSLRLGSARSAALSLLTTGPPLARPRAVP